MRNRNLNIDLSAGVSILPAMRNWLALILLQAGFLGSAAALDYTTYDPPGATGAMTRVTGIEGDTVVGWFRDADSNQTGFIYDGGWSLLSNPDESDPDLLITGIQGGTVFGTLPYSSVPFGTTAFYLNGGGTIVPVTRPGYNGTIFTGGRGGRVAGTSLTMSGPEAFVLDISGGIYTTLAPPPGASSVSALGADAESVVGYYTLGGADRAFLYRDGEWTDLIVPGADGLTVATAVEGGRVAGYYGAGGTGYGFIWEDGAFLTFSIPDAVSTQIYALDGDRVGGTYQDALGNDHGFVAVIPEPSVLGFLLPAAPLLLRRLRRSL